MNYSADIEYDNVRLSDIPSQTDKSKSDNNEIRSKDIPQVHTNAPFYLNSKNLQDSHHSCPKQAYIQGMIGHFNRHLYRLQDPTVDRSSVELLSERLLQGPEPLFQLLFTCPTIKAVNFYECLMSNGDWKGESHFSGDTLELSEIGIKNCAFDEDFFRAFISKVKKLSKLRINEYNGKNLDRIIRAITAQQFQLKTIEFSGILEHGPISNGLDDKIEVELLALLEHLQTVENFSKLSFTNHCFSSNFLDRFFASLPKLKKISSFTWDSNDSGFLKGFQSFDIPLESVEKLNFSGNELSNFKSIEKFAVIFPNIKCLSLRNCNISCSQLQILMTKGFPNLKALDVSSNSLGDKIFELIKDLSLEKLVLQSCNLEFQSKELIPLPKSLTYLDISVQDGFRKAEILQNLAAFLEPALKSSPSLRIICYGLELNLEKLGLSQHQKRISYGLITTKAKENHLKINQEFKKRCDPENEEEYLYRELRKISLKKEKPKDERAFASLVYEMNSPKAIKDGILPNVIDLEGIKSEKNLYVQSFAKNINFPSSKDEIPPTSKDALILLKNAFNFFGIDYQQFNATNCQGITTMIGRLPLNEKNQNFSLINFKVEAFF